MNNQGNGGRGRGRTNRRIQGCGRMQGRGSYTQRSQNYQHREKKYKVPDTAIKELGDNIYIIDYPELADKCIKTTEAILVYVQQNYKHGDDIRTALKDEKDYNFDPEEPTISGPIDTTQPEGFKYKLKMKAFQCHIDTYTTNKTNVRGIIYN